MKNVSESQTKSRSIFETILERKGSQQRGNMEANMIPNLSKMATKRHATIGCEKVIEKLTVHIKFKRSQCEGKFNLYKSFVNLVLLVGKNCKYIGIFFAICASLKSVSILHVTLLVLIVGKYLSKNYFKFMTIPNIMIYISFLMFVRYISFILYKDFPMFNIEILSIIGIYSGNQSNYYETM